MTLSNIPDELGYEAENEKIRFTFRGISTKWMDFDDPFIERIHKNRLNMVFFDEHLLKEIEIKNLLDEGISFLNSDKYLKAIENFDEILFYDPGHCGALLNKSYALRGQKHFVKALRHYKRAASLCGNLSDAEYHKKLLKESHEERDNFPRIKLNIYAGDEYFAVGEFEKAIESYDRALKDSSGFKDRILSKLLNKKATALLKTNEFGEALVCFKQSRNAGVNDYAIWGEGFCEHKLGLSVCEEFKSLLGLSKNEMLMQAVILNDLGFFRQSLVICDLLWKNHFKIDGFYLKLIDVRRVAMDELDMDLSEIDRVSDVVRHDGA